MDHEQLTAQLTELVRQTVNAIADDEYEKLEGLLELNSSWYSEDGTMQDAIEEFRTAIQSNYEGWAEDTGKEYRIDRFNPDNLMEECSDSARELLESGSTILSYDLKTTDDDPDYFFMEFDCSLADGTVHAVLDLNV